MWYLHSFAHIHHTEHTNHQVTEAYSASVCTWVTAESLCSGLLNAVGLDEFSLSSTNATYHMHASTQGSRTPAMLRAHSFHPGLAVLTGCGHTDHVEQKQKHKEKQKLLPLPGNSSVVELPVCAGPGRQKKIFHQTNVKGCVVVKLSLTLLLGLEYYLWRGCILRELWLK